MHAKENVEWAVVRFCFCIWQIATTRRKNQTNTAAYKQPRNPRNKKQRLDLCKVRERPDKQAKKKTKGVGRKERNSQESNIQNMRPYCSKGRYVPLAHLRSKWSPPRGGVQKLVLLLRRRSLGWVSPTANELLSDGPMPSMRM